MCGERSPRVAVTLPSRDPPWCSARVREGLGLIQNKKSSLGSAPFGFCIQTGPPVINGFPHDGK
jgi:hypothetical protein